MPFPIPKDLTVVGRTRHLIVLLHTLPAPLTRRMPIGTTGLKKPFPSAIDRPFVVIHRLFQSHNGGKKLVLVSEWASKLLRSDTKFRLRNRAFKADLLTSTRKIADAATY